MCMPVNRRRPSLAARVQPRRKTRCDSTEQVQCAAVTIAAFSRLPDEHSLLTRRLLHRHSAIDKLWNGLTIRGPWPPQTRRGSQGLEAAVAYPAGVGDYL